MTDYSSYFGGSTGGGSSSGGAYGGYFTGSATKKKKPSSGGGFFDSIGGFLGGIPGVSVAGNAGGQAWDIIHGTPNALVHLPGMALHDITRPHVSLIDLLQNPSKGLHGLGQELHDPKGLVGSTYMPIETDVSKARHGDWHYFQQHPLNPILDVATVLSLGGGGALKLARAGTLGERAATLAKSERLLKVGDHVEPLDQATTLQGRLRQRAFDRYSMEHADTPIIGANRRMAKIATQRAYSETLRAHVPMRQFQRITGKLTKDERFAFHVGAEGVPLDERIAFYRGRLGEAPNPHLKAYLKRLEAPGVRKVLTEPRQQFVDALNAGKALEAKSGERLAEADRLTPETRADRALLPQETMTPGAVSAEANAVHPDFPAPYRFPHVASGKAPALYTAPKTEGMLGKARPLPQLRKNWGVRLKNALFATDPERVLSSDYLSTMKEGLVVQMQREMLDGVAKPLSAEWDAYGYKRPEEFYYRPSYDRKTTAPIPPEVRQRQALAQEHGVEQPTAAAARTESIANESVSQDARDLGAAAKDPTLEELNKLGIKRVPAAFGKEYTEQFAGTSRFVRNFIDRPLDVWRMITLNYRPAWAVNNLVGNAVMFYLRHPAGAGAYLRVLLAHEKGEANVLKLWTWTKRHPPLVRKYRPVFEEVAPQLHSVGLFGSQKLTHEGIYEKVGAAETSRAAKALRLPKRAIVGALKAPAQAITAFEIHFAEDLPREAAFLREVGADVAKIRATAKSMGEANVSLAEAIRRLDRPTVEMATQRVSDALGDFNAMSPFERRYLRRWVPFENWYRVILTVSGKYAARFPGRITLLHNIAQAQNTKGEPPLPKWLDGAILVGKAHGGTQSLLSTKGINPYETLTQLGQDNPAASLNPAVAAGIVAASGRDPFLMSDYYGPGATTQPGPVGAASRFFGSLGYGLAPVQLASKMTQPYSGKLYDPTTYRRNVLLQYLGIPLRDVRLQEAKRERGLG